MTTTITYKQTPPRRPTLGDLHGGQVIDDTEFPPDTGDPHADAMNQADALVVAAHNVIDVVRLYITFPSGVPTKAGLWSTRDDLGLSDFTLTDNGAGDTSIVHAGGKLPAAQWPAQVAQVDDTEIDRIRAVPITNGCRIKTKLGAVGTDCAVVVCFSGI